MGENWYLIEQIDSAKRSAAIKIYNDYTGDLIQDKWFHLHGDSLPTINWQNLQPDINSFDGHRIYLNSTGKDSEYCFLE